MSNRQKVREWVYARYATDGVSKLYIVEFSDGKFCLRNDYGFISIDYDSEEKAKQAAEEHLE